MTVLNKNRTFKNCKDSKQIGKRRPRSGISVDLREVNGASLTNHDVLRTQNTNFKYEHNYAEQANRGRGAQHRNTVCDQELQ